MTLPVIVVTTRAALASVAQTLKEAAWGWATLQVLFHHVVPTAARNYDRSDFKSRRALGETALLIIGWWLYCNSSSHFLSPATVLPVQIFNWSRSPELGFIENTSGAILVLLVLALFNGVAVFIRKRFEELK
jgi:phosphate transport system permease protein